MRDEGGTLVFRATPRLYMLSSKPGSGKSLILELLDLLCPATFGLDLEPSVAGLVKTLNSEKAVVLLDEGDVLFGKGARHSGIRAIINGGYRRKGKYLTADGRKSVFGALALAALDVAEKDTGDKLKALFSRGFKIRMEMASKDDRPGKVRRRQEEQAGKLNEWLQAWAAQVRDDLADAEPIMPEELENRAEEISEPLVAIGDAAGGEWPERARAACVELSLAQAAPPVEEDESVLDEFASFAASLGSALPATEPDYGDEEE